MPDLDKINKNFTLVLIIVAVILNFSIGIIVAYYNTQQYQTLIVAKTISAEACSAGPSVMFGVGSTIRNRMKLRNKTAYEIVTELNQYYGYTNKNRDKIFKDPKCSVPAKFIAKNINTLPDTVNGGIFFKFQNEVKQAWHKTLTETINDCEFYK